MNAESNGLQLLINWDVRCNSRKKKWFYQYSWSLDCERRVYPNVHGASAARWVKAIDKLIIESKLTVTYIGLKFDSKMNFFRKIKAAADNTAGGVSILNRQMPNVGGLTSTRRHRGGRGGLWMAFANRTVSETAVIVIPRQSKVWWNWIFVSGHRGFQAYQYKNGKPQLPIVCSAVGWWTTPIIVNNFIQTRGISLSRQRCYRDTEGHWRIKSRFPSIWDSLERRRLSLLGWQRFFEQQFPSPSAPSWPKEFLELKAR